MMFIKNSPNIAIVTENSEISYTDLLKTVALFSDILGKLDGKRVLIISENRPEYIYAFYGIWKSDGIVVPVDFMSTPDEIAYIINDCSPDAVFFSEKVRENVVKAIEIAGKTKIKKIVFEDIQGDISKYEAADFDVEDKEKTSLIIYTSGTTGSPKGVMLSCRNIMANMDALQECGYYTQSDVVLMILPLHHVFPLLGTVVAPLLGGGRAVICPSLQASDIAKMMEKSHPTMILAVPRFYEMLMKGIMQKINSGFLTKAIFNIAKIANNTAFSKIIFKSVAKKFGGNMKHFICGGAKLDPEVWNCFKVLGFSIGDGYGMTEASPMITFPRPGKGKAGCVGTELSKGTVKIVDGEIVATGKNIMKGYYNRPEETAEVLRDGWLYTGDLGHFDKEGNLCITGRKKEIIILGNGKNVNPTEIEQDIERSDSLIKEIAVIAKNGVLCAIIRPDEKVLAERQIPNLEEFIRWEIIDKYNSTASHHKKILDFVLTNQPLPRTRLDKIQRFKLEDFLQHKDEKRAESDVPETKEYKKIAGYIRKTTEKDVFPDDHIEIDLGLDSLDKIELASFINSEFGIKITETDIQNLATVRKIADFTSERESKKADSTKQDWKTVLRENLNNMELPRSAFYHRLLRFSLVAAVRTFFKVRFSGTENIPKGPVIFAANHQSVVDALFVLAKIPAKEFKRTYCFAKGKHFQQWWRRYMAKRNNIIIMREDEEIVDSIKRMASVLKKGRNVLIFPEGTRSRDGGLGDFKQTFSLLACEINVPIVPVAIDGAFEAFPRNRKFPHPFKKITVTYLPPISPEGKTREELAAAVKKAIEEKIKK
ncbi:AMP-binding protein [bacterium]|nr:AMP-binding protein [bacterium]